MTEDSVSLIYIYVSHFLLLYLGLTPCLKLLPPWQKGCVFLVALICFLFVCCKQNYSKSYMPIAMNFYGGVWGWHNEELIKF